MDRLIALYQAFAANYDDEPYFEATVTAETAVAADASDGYTSSAFVTQYQRLITQATTAWQNTLFRLNANFVSVGSNANMQTLIDQCVTSDCGVGGPDIFATDTGTPPTQAQNVLDGSAFEHDYRGEIPIMFSAEQ